MTESTKVKVLDKVVVRFSGDSGDGMQLAGNIFSAISAAIGNEISTFPDYPAEIRAPQGTLSGVSGFQVHIGKGVYTPGDKADVLVAMNPAALKTNIKFLKKAELLLSTPIHSKRATSKSSLYHSRCYRRAWHRPVTSHGCSHHDAYQRGIGRLGTRPEEHRTLQKHFCLRTRVLAL